MSRPKMILNWESIAQNVMAGAKGTEIAASLGCSEKTIYQRCETDLGIKFSEFLARNRAKGDSLLRVKQFDVAMEGDRSMLIWLGKNRLGQTDKSEAVQTKIQTINTALELSNLSIDELENLERIIAKLESSKDSDSEEEL